MSLFNNTINYKTSSGSYVRGEWVAADPVSSTFSGTVQPMSGKEVDSLPVGRRDKGKVKVYTGQSLKVSVAGKDYTGDIILWEGFEWEIIQKLPNQSGIINHYKYVAEERKAI